MKEFRTENNDINTNLIYELKEDEMMDMVAVEMIQQNLNIPGLLRMIYTQNNSLCVLKYNITSKITLQQLLERNVTKKVIISILINIIRTIVSADEYLLEQDGFVLDMDKVFVDLSSYDVGMIYLPIKAEKKNIDYSMFFKNLILISKYDSTENCEYVAQIISYLNSASFSLIGFYDFLQQIGGLKEESVNEVITEQSSLNNISVQNNIDYMVNQGNSAENKSVKTIVDTFSVTNMSNGNEMLQKNKISEVSGENQVQMPVNSPVSGRNQVQMPENSPVSGRNQIHMPVNSPVSGRNQMQIPGQSPVAVNQMQQNNLTVKKDNKSANKKEKKKGRLFGGKSEKNNKDMNIPNSNIQDMNFKPNNNQTNMSGIQNNVRTNNMPNNSGFNNAGVKSNIFNNESQYNVGVSNISNNIVPGFGETTVLGINNTGETTVLSPDMNPNIQSNMKQAYLIREKNGERIPVTKEKFLIGKEKSFVDYFIADNTAISRSHAYIINHNNDYYIVDTNSKNHTYINGKLITPNTEISIANDCRIKLADEEFIFNIM